jgi:isopentenyl diphosphate isomerase/L-lactate dehydrogenase-like FMN-dependent dehydrogenase
MPCSPSLTQACHGRIFLGSGASQRVCITAHPLTLSTTNTFLVPIILKGISTAEDAVLAYEAGVQGIVLSNHGGRQLDTARSGLEVLVEVVAALKARGYYPDPKFEIFVDGGVRRASDVLKAIALGAKAVGVGRAFLYAFCAYGQEGVERAIQIFRVCKGGFPVCL